MSMFSQAQNGIFSRRAINKKTLPRRRSIKIRKSRESEFLRAFYDFNVTSLFFFSVRQFGEVAAKSWIEVDDFSFCSSLRLLQDPFLFKTS